MTLTVSPEAMIIGLLLVVVALLAWIAWRVAMLREMVSDIVGVYFRAAESDNKATFRALQSQQESILNGDKAILAVAQANNAGIELLCGKGGVMDAGKLGRTRQALKVAQEFALEKGLDPADVGIPDLLREMGEDTP